MNCQHCDNPNPENWFNCKKCGERATPPKWTPQVVIRDSQFATAFRKDQIDINIIDGEDYAKQVVRDRKQKYA